MLHWAAMALAIVIVAGVLGFGAVAGASAVIAQSLYFVLAAALVASLATSLSRRV